MKIQDQNNPKFKMVIATIWDKKGKKTFWESPKIEIENPLPSFLSRIIVLSMTVKGFNKAANNCSKISVEETTYFLI